ncbi:MAG: TolC family protein [Planctomycetota bacterium]
MPRGSRDLLRMIGQSAIALSLMGLRCEFLAAQEAKPTTESGQVLDLEACLSMAMDQQASIRAARATLHANMAKSDALERSGRLGAILSIDLKVRRQQVLHGIQAARLAVEKAENETRQAVTFTYLMAVYAKQQRRELSAILTNLKQLREGASRLVERFPGQLELVDIANNASASKVPEAENGYEQALAALREAIGTSDRVTPVNDAIPEGKCSISSQDEAIAKAVANRPEIGQAELAAVIFALEIEAQCRMRFTMAGRTLASGSDLHSILVPLGQFDEKYQPGAIAPEMPSVIPGNRRDRVNQAEILASRATIVREKVQALVELEAGNAWLRYKQNADKLPVLEKAIKVAHKRSEDLKEDLGGDNKVSPRDVLESGLIETTLKQQSIEAKLGAIQALATLERATGGAFKLDLEWKPVAPGSKSN